MFQPFRFHTGAASPNNGFHATVKIGSLNSLLNVKATSVDVLLQLPMFYCSSAFKNVVDYMACAKASIVADGKG